MAMTSVTRSSRRVDGIHRHPHMVVTSTRSHQRHQHQHQHQHQINGSATHESNPSRTKRYLASPESDLDAIRQKKQRISVDIPSRLSVHPKRLSESTATVRGPPVQAATQAPGVVTTVANSGLPDGPDAAAPPTTTTTTTTTAAPASTTTGAGAAALSSDNNNNNENPSSLTRHKEKVVNGLKHELGRLNPTEPEVSASSTREQGRKLRSQEATRFKSDLSAYFPDYDETIGNDPRETHLLNLDTPIVITDAPLSPSSTPQHQHDQHGQQETFPVRGYGDSLFTDLFDSQTIDFGFLQAQYKDKSPQDPLPDAFFKPAHRKAERLERSIRNSEKGRAQHERDQIARLLDGLQGHDWLRVMGVSGITESKKRAFEPARSHFIKGCQAILDKFRAWAAEEKRRKLEKERAAAEEAEAAAQQDEEGDTSGIGEGDDAIEAPPSLDLDDDSQNGVDEDARTTSEGADMSDVDASIAKQLREEALAAARTKSRGAKAGGKSAAPGGSSSHPAVAEQEQPKELTSFFQKRYQREAALNKSRRRGRTVLAWGHPVPDMPEAEFHLPDGLRDEDTLKSHARQKRRDRRGKHNA